MLAQALEWGTNVGVAGHMQVEPPRAAAHPGGGFVPKELLKNVDRYRYLSGEQERRV